MKVVYESGNNAEQLHVRSVNLSIQKVRGTLRPLTLHMSCYFTYAFVLDNGANRYIRRCPPACMKQCGNQVTLTATKKVYVLVERLKT